MAAYIYVEDFLYRFFYVFNSRVTELINFARIKYYMIVLLVKVGFLVKALVLTKLMFSNKPTSQQELYSIV